MNKLEFKTATIGYPLLFVLSIWIVFWAEVRFGFNFNEWGVLPRDLTGLRGVLLSPFIHSNIEHLYSNSLPLLFLSMALFYFYQKVSWKVLGWGLLLSGVLTWILGRGDSVHIGASGVVYLLASFLFFKGIWSKNYRLTALSLIVVFFYGSMVWGMFPIDETMSWEGHLGGFLSGLLLALRYKKVDLPQKKYRWEKPDYNEEEDEFMKHFDADGNFIPTAELYPEEAPEEEENTSLYIEYTYIASAKKKTADTDNQKSKTN